MKERILGWFFGLQPRERWIVGCGSAAAVVIVVWGFIVAPLNDEIARLRTSIDAKQRLLVDVARVEGMQPPAVAPNRQGSGQTLMVIVSDTARSHGLAAPRTRANGPSGVDVSFQGASYDAVVAWLVTLQQSYGVDVETASFVSTREPGLVNVQLSLRRL
jgi:type II secretory pathway component PulM